MYRKTKVAAGLTGAWDENKHERNQTSRDFKSTGQYEMKNAQKQQKRTIRTNKCRVKGGRKNANKANPQYRFCRRGTVDILLLKNERPSFHGGREPAKFATPAGGRPKAVG